MQNEKDKPPSFFNHRELIIFLVLALALSSIITFRNDPWTEEYHVGDIARENIRASADLFVPQRDITIKKNEMIVREGERITAQDVQELSALKAATNNRGAGVQRFFFLFVLLFLSMTVVYEYAERNIKKFLLTEKDLLFGATLLLFSMVVAKSMQLLFEHFTPGYAPELFYLIPIFFFGIIMRTVLFSEASIIFGVMFSITMGLTFGSAFPVFLYTLIGSLLASYFSGKCENRNTILKAGLYTAFLMILLSIIHDAFLQNRLDNLPVRMLLILLSGVGSSFITLGLLPVIEHVFDYTTDIELLELANLEHPLLKEMMVSAPGTYHHSIVVGNLSKAAAESIGAHPLLTRVSAYYHDIGKLKMPHYFIENRTTREDAHEALSPSMSGLIILSHVKEGIDLAHQYKLGSKITEIIRQHHGTSLVSYFFSRAKEQEDPRLHVTEEKDFRYGGPRPQTKEAGIIMLADAVEASSRVLDDPSPKRIETHVQNIIEAIFLDGQLDECELTLKDLHAIQRSFTNIMIGIFHHRIEYPERAGNGGTDKKIPKITEDRYKEPSKNSRRFANLFRAAG
jgi:putative nucleotidyltransferase with HDIG domain